MPDGLNPVGTGELTDGKRMNIHQLRGRSTFDVHPARRIEDNSVTSVEEFKATLKRLTESPDNLAFQFATDSGDARLVVGEPTSGWQIMLDDSDMVHTLFKVKPNWRMMSKLNEIRVLRDYLGVFK